MSPESLEHQLKMSRVFGTEFTESNFDILSYICFLQIYFSGHSKMSWGVKRFTVHVVSLLASSNGMSKVKGPEAVSYQNFKKS